MSHAFIPTLLPLRQRWTRTRVVLLSHPPPKCPSPPARAKCASKPLDGNSHSLHSVPRAPSPVPSSVTQPSPPLLLLLLSSVAIVSIALYLSRVPLSAHLSFITSRIASLPPLQASLVLAFTNFFTVLLCFPANMGLMIAAGALLGPVPAFLALFSSKLAAACVAFLLARGVLSARVHTWLDTRPRLARLLRDSGSAAGWKFVLLMRLSPFPGFLLNYLLSLTGVTFVDYVAATMLGIAPSISNLVLLGATARGVVADGGVAATPLALAIRVLCVLSMLLVTVLIARSARRAFSDMEEAALADDAALGEDAT